MFVASHGKLVHDTEINICDLCSQEFKGFVKLKIHKRRFHKDLEECNLCGKMMKNLNKHRMIMHTENDKKKCKCTACGKGFIGTSQLKEHSITHRSLSLLKEGRV